MPLPRLHDVTRVVTMKSDTLASVKAHFSAVVDEVHSTHQRVTVTRNGQPVAVLVSPDDLASMEETIALLSDAAELAAVAEKLRGSGSTALTVTGHTDSTGTASHNQGLSERRARSVTTALEALVPGVAITAVGKGASEPVADNDTDEGRALNRRVVIATG